MLKPDIFFGWISEPDNLFCVCIIKWPEHNMMFQNINEIIMFFHNFFEQTDLIW